jgi:hypothetical protein
LRKGWQNSCDWNYRSGRGQPSSIRFRASSIVFAPNFSIGVSSSLAHKKPPLSSAPTSIWVMYHRLKGRSADDETLAEISRSSRSFLRSVRSSRRTGMISERPQSWVRPARQW